MHFIPAMYMIGNRCMIQYPILYAMYIIVTFKTEMEYDLSDNEIRFEFVWSRFADCILEGKLFVLSKWGNKRYKHNKLNK